MPKFTQMFHIVFANVGIPHFKPSAFEDNWHQFADTVILLNDQFFAGKALDIILVFSIIWSGYKSGKM